MLTAEREREREREGKRLEIKEAGNKKGLFQLGANLPLR